jgi:cell division protein FtsI (penicillin-binding protein 3)
MRSADVRKSARRVAIARAALLFTFTVLAARAAHLSVFDERAAQRADDQAEGWMKLRPDRGSIVDRNGAGLALTLEAPSVYAVGREVRNPAAAARSLAAILGMDRGQLARNFRQRAGFSFVRRWITPEQGEKIAAAKIPGVGVVNEPRRIYPYRALAARVVGFANIDGDGVRGIEQQENAWLRGTTRRLRVERDGSGRYLLSDSGTAWGTAGGDVALTIDAALQADAERALAAAIERTGARGGLVLAMDPHTGEVLSAAESPGFDPNRFRRTTYQSTRSSAFLDAMEPGSALKAFLVAGALDHGVIGSRDVIDTEGGRMRVPGKTITDKHDYGPLDPGGVLRVSSNIGAVKIGYALGPRAHFEALRAFGFGASTRSLFPDESSGVLRSWKEWRPIDHATISFGQGISVTPVQLAAAASSIANGGLLVRPRLIAARRAPGGGWQPTRSEVIRRVIRPETARTLLGMLEGVVSDEGTARAAELPGVRVAGKTGTAQKWDEATGTYSQTRYRAWFIGFAPADDPRIVIVSELDEPKHPLHTGGAAAAPLFAQVAPGQLAYHGIFLRRDEVQVARAAAPPPVSSSPPVVASFAQRAQVARSEPQASEDHGVGERRPSGEARAPSAAPASSARGEAERTAAAGRGAAPMPTPPTVALSAFRDRVLLPDFSGLSKSEVSQVTAKNGLRVKLDGDGLAVRQDPPPGSVVVAGSEIVRIQFRPAKPRGEAAIASAHGDRF